MSSPRHLCRRSWANHLSTVLLRVMGLVSPHEAGCAVFGRRTVIPLADFGRNLPHVQHVVHHFLYGSRPDLRCQHVLQGFVGNKVWSGCFAGLPGTCGLPEFRFTEGLPWRVLALLGELPVEVFHLLPSGCGVRLGKDALHVGGEVRFPFRVVCEVVLPVSCFSQVVQCSHGLPVVPAGLVDQGLFPYLVLALLLLLDGLPCLPALGPRWCSTCFASGIFELLAFLEGGQSSCVGFRDGLRHCLESFVVSQLGLNDIWCFEASCPPCGRSLLARVLYVDGGGDWLVVRSCKVPQVLDLAWPYSSPLHHDVV